MVFEWNLFAYSERLSTNSYNFSLLLHVKLSLLILFASFWYKFFAPFLMALPTIAIAIVIALSDLKDDSKKITITFANTFKSIKENNYCCYNSWKIINSIGSNTKKKP